jgi:regulatory protein YycI of two-component signal transduction system YycFG
MVVEEITEATSEDRREQEERRSIAHSTWIQARLRRKKEAEKAHQAHQTSRQRELLQAQVQERVKYSHRDTEEDVQKESMVEDMWQNPTSHQGASQWEWTTEDIKATEGTSRTVCVAALVSEDSDEDIPASKKGRWTQEEERIFVNSTKIIFEEPDNSGPQNNPERMKERTMRIQESRSVPQTKKTSKH